jgi:hypothetical protein
MITKRMVKESPVSQGVDERIPYTLTVHSTWGTVQGTGIVVTVFDITDTTDEADWVNVTATVMPTNTPTVSNNAITLSKLRDLEDGHIYRMEIQFDTTLIENAEAYCLFIGGE